LFGHFSAFVKHSRIPNPGARSETTTKEEADPYGTTNKILLVEHVDPGLEDLGAEGVGEAVECVVKLLHLAGQVGQRAGDGDDAEGGAVPKDGVVELGYADVEAVAELVLEGADYLAAVFEGLRVRDGEFEGEFGYGHVWEYSFVIAYGSVEAWKMGKAPDGRGFFLFSNSIIADGA
jgi:hypothetical protein